MRHKKLQILVSGESNTGKSTIAEMIRGILVSYGIRAKVSDVDQDLMSEEGRMSWFLLQERRMATLAANGIDIEIKTVPLMRRPK
jgi:adenylylsulfate kinase-like enzyme